MVQANAKSPARPSQWHWFALLLASHLAAAQTPPHAAATSPPNDTSQPDLQLYTEAAPPRNYLAADGKTVVGTATEKIRKALEQLRIKYRIQLTDWSRAFKLAQQQDNACVYSTARLPERENLFQWIGPVSQISFQLFGRKNEAKPSSLEMVRGKRICVLLNDAPGLVLQHQGFNIIPVLSHQACPRNVANGNSDYWAIGLEHGLDVIRTAGLQQQIEPQLSFQLTDLFLACNLSIPKATITRLQARIKQNGQP